MREKWKRVHATVKLDTALKAFLTESLKVCGETLDFGVVMFLKNVITRKALRRTSEVGYVPLDVRND